MRARMMLTGLAITAAALSGGTAHAQPELPVGGGDPESPMYYTDLDAGGAVVSQLPALPTAPRAAASPSPTAEPVPDPAADSGLLTPVQAGALGLAGLVLLGGGAGLYVVARSRGGRGEGDDYDLGEFVAPPVTGVSLVGPATGRPIVPPVQPPPVVSGS